MSLSQRAIATSVILCHYLLPLSALAEGSPQVEQPPQVNHHNSPEPNRPGLRGDVGTARGTTVIDETPLMALMTENQLTISQRPTFFFYIPEGVAGDVAKFRVETSDSLIYQEEFTLVGDDEILMLSLNRDSVQFSLEPETDYRWYFEIIGNRDEQNQDETQNIPINAITGIIRLVDIDDYRLESPEELDSIGELDPYHNQGLWIEWVVGLTELQCDPPNRQAFNDKWLDFLTWIDEELARLASQPLRNLTTLHSCSSDVNSSNTPEVLPEGSEQRPRPAFLQPPDRTGPDRGEGGGTR